MSVISLRATSRGFLFAGSLNVPISARVSRHFVAAFA